MVAASLLSSEKEKVAEAAEHLMEDGDMMEKEMGEEEAAHEGEEGEDEEDEEEIKQVKINISVRGGSGRPPTWWEHLVGVRTEYEVEDPTYALASAQECLKILKKRKHRKARYAYRNLQRALVACFIMAIFLDLTVATELVSGKVCTCMKARSKPIDTACTLLAIHLLAMLCRMATKLRGPRLRSVYYLMMACAALVFYLSLLEVYSSIFRINVINKVKETSAQPLETALGDRMQIEYRLTLLDLVLYTMYMAAALGCLYLAKCVKRIYDFDFLVDLTNRPMMYSHCCGKEMKQKKRCHQTATTGCHVVNE